jgi:uncharacterized membrane protein YdbT with pleckstrin-like domain
LRDFNAQNIGGNVIINDNSNQFKPLNQCTNEELTHEEQHRARLLDKERSHKNSVFQWSIVVAVLFLVVAYLWYQFNGEYRVGTTMLTAIGVIVGFSAFSASGRKSDFEKRQIAALHEIHMILRERGVR